MHRSRASSHPDAGGQARAEQIRADLKLLAPLTRAVRTYSSTGGVELVPGIASEFGLRVTVGAWIDKNKERNEREMRSVIDLAKRHSNVNSIVVGNETIYRGEQTVADLIQMIQRVKRSTTVPVTTGEIWNVWLEHPELVSAVDFIAAHILPYWEGFSDKQRRRSGHPDLRQAAPGLSRQAHRDRRVRLAERRLQSQERQSRPHRAGGRAARLRHARRGLRHRLQHRRSDRPAVEDLRRRRRSLLGPVRHLAPAQVHLDRPDHQSRSLAARRHRAAGERAAVAADPGDDRRDAVADRDCWRPPPMSSAPGSPPCSPIGTDIISCRAPPSRWASAPCC